MVNLRKTQISGGLFSCYSTYIDIDEIDTLDDIIQLCISNLNKDLKKLNLEELLNNLDPRVFHIHSVDITDILISDPEFIIYVCNHC